MLKIRNTGILSLYLSYLVNAWHKNLKTFAVLVYGHVYIILVILRSQNKITNLTILAWKKSWKERIIMQIIIASNWGGVVSLSWLSCIHLATQQSCFHYVAFSHISRCIDAGLYKISCFACYRYSICYEYVNA